MRLPQRSVRRKQYEGVEGRGGRQRRGDPQRHVEPIPLSSEACGGAVGGWWQQDVVVAVERPLPPVGGARGPWVVSVEFG